MSPSEYRMSIISSSRNGESIEGKFPVRLKSKESDDAPAESEI